LDCQNDSTVSPIGVTAPIPVITISLVIASPRFA
jgi:hypothetical protein